MRLIIQIIGTLFFAQNSFAAKAEPPATAGKAEQSATAAKVEPPATVAKPAVSAASSLTISSRAGLFRVEADHADVQTVIKQLFEKGDRQFNLENGVSGIVTLRLTEQPLRVILDEICRQTFLQYHFDGTTGIYRFQRNEQALRAAILRLHSLNNLLRQQLESMGLEVIHDSARSLSASPAASATVLNTSSARGEGGAANAPAGLEKLTDNVSKASKISEVQLKRSLLSDKPTVILDSKGIMPRKSSSISMPTRNSLIEQNEESRPKYLQIPRSPQQILAESRSVSFRIPNGHPLPVADVLQQIGKQAQVSVVIDPEVPAGLKLRIEGSVSSRPLPDLLNILTAYARLEWRWEGDHILITPRPDFRLFVGETAAPRVDSSKASPARDK